MGAVIHIPGYLRQFTEGRDRIQLDATPATVGDALAVIWDTFPGVRDRIVTESGAVRPHVNIFLGDESIRYTGGLATPVEDRAEISIIPAVSGG